MGVPSGAFKALVGKPAMNIIATQGSDGPIDASPVRIGRMLAEIDEHERTIRELEDRPVTSGRRYANVGGKVAYVDLAKIALALIAEARAQRDEHIAELRHVIDYALTEVAYDDVACTVCQLPAAALDFIKAVADFEQPATVCKACADRKTVRVKKADPQSVLDFKTISYFSKVLGEVILCAKIRAGASDQSAAYLELETQNRNLLVKFGNERQTSVEGLDAEQGVRTGLLDAARRFDPLHVHPKTGKLSMASFGTVAYTWCFRNSRARQPGQKRAGVYAPSIEAMGTDEDGNGMAALITDTEGGLGTFSSAGGGNHDLMLDFREKISGLPEIERKVVMAGLAGRSTAEIGRDLGITGVKVRRVRETAYERLREVMGGYCVEMLRE